MSSKPKWPTIELPGGGVRNLTLSGYMERQRQEHLASKPYCELYPGGNGIYQVYKDGTVVKPDGNVTHVSLLPNRSDRQRIRGYIADLNSDP